MFALVSVAQRLVDELIRSNPIWPGQRHWASSATSESLAYPDEIGSLNELNSRLNQAKGTSHLSVLA